MNIKENRKVQVLKGSGIVPTVYDSFDATQNQKRIISQSNSSIKTSALSDLDEAQKQLLDQYEPRAKVKL